MSYVKSGSIYAFESVNAIEAMVFVIGRMCALFPFTTQPALKYTIEEPAE